MLVYRFVAFLIMVLAFSAAAEPWVRHTIDASSKGADGVRMLDVNGNGHRDIVTPWEEGNEVRAYINPGPEHVKGPWNWVSVGCVGTPEDAVFADLDGDGNVDVVSACEGNTRTVYIHWAPAEAEDYLSSEAWNTEPVPASVNRAMWMWTVPMDVNNNGRLDLVCGSKGNDAVVGWFEAPENPRDMAAWTWRHIRDAGWIMSIIPMDMNGNGTLDLVISDRRGARRGCYWLECPADLAEEEWTEHRIGGDDKEVMFMTMNGPEEALAAVRGLELLRFHFSEGAWHETIIPLPPKAGTGKGVALGDINGNGTNDIVFSCEGALKRHGLMWLAGNTLNEHDIAGLEGTKYDLVVLYDMDGDGDLDVVTCEEQENLGLIWYENPRR
jgi:hypothetical protein